jgi:hypothetical protein
MHLDKIVDRRSGYYMAMYSAHASIIENIIGKRGKVARLIVDAGGLKAPKGSYKRKEIFFNYLAATGKTLHAKVIYLDKPRVLSLWTGNLRYNTWANQENIIITKEISKKQGNMVTEWFYSCHKGKHLIVFVENGKVVKITSTSKSIWESFKSKCQGAVDGEDKLSVYAFSPWGSLTFIKQISGFLGKGRLKKLNLYTRSASQKYPLWVDGIADQAGECNSYIRNTETLPHYKCVFITKGERHREKVVFAYIGSANLTKAAFFKKTNIEFGLLFSGIRKNDDVERIFRVIRRSQNWEEREYRGAKNAPEDESWEINEDDDNTDNFKIRAISKKLCKKLALKRWQLKLESMYRKDKVLKLLGCALRVQAVLKGIFDLHVVFGKLSFDLSIKRESEVEVFSKMDEERLIKDLVRGSGGDGWGGGGGKGTSEESNEKKVYNLKFPMHDCITDKKLLKEKADILNKLVQVPLTGDAKKLVYLWLPIVRHMGRV